MRLLYDEYIFYIVERKLEDVKRRLYEEHWNSEAAVMMQQADSFGHMAAAGTAFPADYNRNVPSGPARIQTNDQFHAMGTGKEVFDDYTT